RRFFSRKNPPRVGLNLEMGGVVEFCNRPNPLLKFIASRLQHPQLLCINRDMEMNPPRAGITERSLGRMAQRLCEILLKHNRSICRASERLMQITWLDKSRQFVAPLLVLPWLIHMQGRG